MPLATEPLPHLAKVAHLPAALPPRGSRCEAYLRAFAALRLGLGFERRKTGRLRLGETRLEVLFRRGTAIRRSSSPPRTPLRSPSPCRRPGWNGAKRHADLVRQILREFGLARPGRTAQQDASSSLSRRRRSCRPGAAEALRRGDGSRSTGPSAARRRRGCRSGSSKATNGRASPARCAGPRRRPADASRTNASACAA